MDDIFLKEKEIISEAEGLIKSKAFHSEEDAKLYEDLLGEYKKLLKQLRSTIKMSDIIQWKLSSRSNGLEKLSNLDELTGLYNRRFFNETYRKEWDNAVRCRAPLGVLMIDIDFFKRYNDTYGHLQGDICLQEIAYSIKKSLCRPRDFVARFGGEEFVALLPETSIEGCASIAERILANVDSLNPIQSTENPPDKVTVSIGVTSVIPDETMDLETVINSADEALYRAKNDGRNCYRK